MNKQFQNLIDKEKKKKDQGRVGKALEASEPEKSFLPLWHDHVIARDEIASFTTIVDKSLYNVFPQKDEVLLPFEEFYGDHAMNWIIGWNNMEKREVFRKNIRQVDMIEWKQELKTEAK